MTFLFLMSGCGVKGDPIPPEQAAEIGRGKPGFERAADELDLTDEEVRYKRKKSEE